ncbi:hypothetical protein, partial [Lentilactobacillus kisonensis]
NPTGSTNAANHATDSGTKPSSTTHQPAKPGKRPTAKQTAKTTAQAKRSTGRVKTQRLANEPVKVAGV